MLVLTRKLGERIVMPHLALAVTVVAIEGNSVRLGISAPENIDIFREEVWRRLRQEFQDSPDQQTEPNAEKKSE